MIISMEIDAKTQEERYRIFIKGKYKSFKILNKKIYSLGLKAIQKQKGKL